ncbi:MULTISPECIES: metal ABC transporter permease [unclassified Haloferax]|uniref:metal ABC transporter permease n=1 Tax=unclassified Haloferax TaxID=2625095 RepID=UPI0002B1FFD1|nr:MULTISPECIES: metal ABC transporter permease [unclassified Haloferax]ELZ59618.1 ABC-type transport system permease [Haloferax sp. ATCC BAA-646]ELZ60507.1 ABC-type transport system permease [Haloferax sp. ATCC BAA-645]ELZ72182.1 ABC-type transport system permease [Haloferax sp. ATCC BAA-644]
MTGLVALAATDLLAVEFSAADSLAPLLVADAFTGLFDWFLTAVVGGAFSWLAGATGLDFLGYPYMQRAYLSVLCIGVVGPLVGSFLVYRDLSMVGDTLAHTAFAGVALALFLDATLGLAVPPLLGALVVAVVAALAVQALIEYTDARSDAALAMVLTGGFALGSVLISLTGGGISVGINQYLFGSLATVSRADVGLLVSMGLVVVGSVAVAYRPLVYVTFDETAARASRLHVRAVNTLLSVLTAFVVVSAMRIMGVILVAALLVVPVVTASRLGRSFKGSLLYGVLAGELAGVAGVTVAYRYGLAAGGSIVLVALAGFVAVAAGRRLA